MISVRIQTLIVSSAPNPSILVLCPSEDYDKRQTCRIVPIWLGTAEATYLGVALEGSRFTRPMTHDLYLDTITNLDATIDRVEIHKVDGQTFYSHLILRQGNRIITLDARPSDAIALATRQDAPIYMSEDVLNAASFPFIFNQDTDGDDRDELAEFRDFLESITPDDFADQPE